MKQRTISGLLTLFVLTAASSPLLAADGTVKFGISSSKSGSFANVGASTKNAAELAKEEINAAGGVKVGGKSYTVELVYVDNGSDKSTATATTLNLISQHQVMAIIGPQSSDRAIPAGEVANSFKTPLVSPWSTSPLTTLNRPYVFRMPCMLDIQGTAMTKFAAKEWKATKVAVLYDEISPYPSGMAKAFKNMFEKINGPGSVVLFETFRTGETDFSKQLNAILNSNADFLYVPQHDTEVPLIVQQAKKMGWKKPITGANAWSGGNLMGKCGDACKGLYFSGNFVAGGTKGIAKTFVDKYSKAYNVLPDEPAALTYDAMKMVTLAMSRMTALTGDLMQDRTNLRDQIAATKNFEGVTGSLSYPGTGDPTKCTIIAKIDESGQFINHDIFCP